MDEELDKTENEEETDEDTKEFMENYDMDKDTAERAVELRDEGLDDDDAAELAEEGL